MGRKSLEKGYSLLEMTVAVGVMSLLLALGIPSLNVALIESEENAAKSALTSASIIMENERYRNGGTYPSPIPNQILRNNEMSNIAITLGNKKLSYCMENTTSRGGTFYLTNNDEAPVESETNLCVTAAAKP